jgi:probable rRNA maturation factor
LAITQTSVNSSFHYKNFRSLKRWLTATIYEEKFSCGDIALVFCSDSYLLELNRKHLGHDYLTDVLSFDYSSGNEISGDIVISIDRVAENAGLFNVDFKKELDRVIIHGVLHFIGYEDSDNSKQAVMKIKEDYYLTKRNDLD